VAATDARMPYTPEAMDEMFHRLVDPTLESALHIASGGSRDRNKLIE